MLGWRKNCRRTMKALTQAMNLRKRQVIPLCCLLLAGVLPSPAAGQQNPGKTNTLNVIVTDHNHHLVSGLKAQDFKVYEGDQPQQISSVNNSSNSACLGLVIDASGSMR